MLAVRLSRARRLRHRKFRGLDRGGGRPRLERLDSWLAARETALSGSATQTNISGVDTGNNELDFAGAHPFEDFDVVRVTSTLTLPAGVPAGDVFVEDAAALAIALAQTAGMRQEGSRIGITDAGTGTISVEPAGTKRSLSRWLHKRLPIEIQNATDLDDL